MYKLYFKDKKEELAIRLFTLYNQEVFNQKIPKETPIEWNSRMRGTAGNILFYLRSEIKLWSKLILEVVIEKL